MQKKTTAPPSAAPKDAAPGKYTVNELRHNSAQLFSCKPEVVGAALGQSKQLFTIDAAKAKIEAFLKKEVEK